MTGHVSDRAPVAAPAAPSPAAVTAPTQPAPATTAKPAQGLEYQVLDDGRNRSTFRRNDDQEYPAIA
jgi:hypothetical protein